MALITSHLTPLLAVRTGEKAEKAELVADLAEAVRRPHNPCTHPPTQNRDPSIMCVLME